MASKRHRSAVKSQWPGPLQGTYSAATVNKHCFTTPSTTSWSFRLFLIVYYFYNDLIHYVFPATGRRCLLVGMAGTFSLEKLPRLAPEDCRPMEVRPPTVVPGSTPSTHRYLTTLCICQHSAHQCSQQFSVPAKNRLVLFLDKWIQHSGFFLQIL